MCAVVGSFARKRLYVLLTSLTMAHLSGLSSIATNSNEMEL